MTGAPPESRRRLGALEAVRAFGVMLGGSIILGATAVAGCSAVLRDLLRLSAPRPWALGMAAGTLVYAFVVRPWHLCWGAEPSDVERTLPGDELLPRGGTEILHAVEIDPLTSARWRRRRREHAFHARREGEHAYDLEAIRVPTLAAHTRDDPLASHEASQRAADRIPGTRFLSLESGGHLMLGQRKIVHDALADIFAERAGPP